MLDAMTPDQFRERYAHWMITQWGDDWTRTGTLAAVVQNLGSIFLAQRTGEPLPMMKPDQFQPTIRLASSDDQGDDVQLDRGLTDEESLAYFERLHT